MRAKIVIALLAILAVGFSVAPSWVKPGVNLNYSVGSDFVSFTVLGRTDSTLQIEMYTQSTNKKTHPNEDPTGMSDQFWVDSASLQYAYSGGLINGYSVTAVGPQTFAGQSWDTVTMQNTVGGALTTKVVDKNTGLLLKQSVAAVGAPTVTLQQFYVPDWVQAQPPPAPVNNTPPPPPPVNPPANVTAPPGNTGNATEPPSNNTLITPDQNSTPPAQGSASGAPEPTIPVPNQSTPCCPSAFILLVLAVATIGSRK